MNRLIYLLTFFILFITFACKNKPSQSPSETINVDTNSIIIQDTINQIELNVADFDTLLWYEITFENMGIILDIRYATKNNFVNKVLYDCPRCFLRPEVAKNILLINKELSKLNYTLKLFDCYRPQPIQQKLWDIVPDARYVTPPSKGSMHNRGLAVDLTIVDKNGNELDMGTDFDYFGKEAYHTCTNLPSNVLDNRLLLKTTMIKYGFRPIRTEWWHYSLKNHKQPLSSWLWKCKHNK